MTDKGLLGKLKSAIDNLLHPGQQHAAPQEAQAAKQPPQQQPHAPDASQRPQLADVLEAMEQQQQQANHLIRGLSQLPEAAGKLAHAAQTQAELAQNWEELLANFAHRNDELTDMYHGLIESSNRQADILQKIQSRLAESGQTDSALAQAAGRLSASLDELNRSNAAHVQVMERVRDHLAAANEQLGDILRAHGRRFTRLLTGVMVVLVLLIVAILIHAAMVK